MADRMDRILVVDIESTCWKGNPPPGQENEIIEIGLCLLDIATLHLLENRSILVRPEHSTVGPYCSELTTLTQEKVAGGISLREACQVLEKDYYSRERIWASFGDYDRLQFERNCRARGIPYPFGSRHINIRCLFAVMHGLSREVRTGEALQMLGLAREGTHHRGGDDAWNVARILAALLRLGRKVER